MKNDIPNDDIQRICEDVITLQINSGILTNFLGGLISQEGPDVILSMIHHFLSSMATGSHASLIGFEIVSYHMADLFHEVKVRVRNQPTGQWHTHIIRSIGKLAAADGEFLSLDPEE
jgi:hypothetical protein